MGSTEIKSTGAESLLTILQVTRNLKLIVAALEMVSGFLLESQISCP
jgi:hypothetical protein